MSMVVEDLLWLALGLCPPVGRCRERGEGIEDGFSGEWHPGLHEGVSMAQCLERARLLFWLQRRVCGHSHLRLPRGGTLAGSCEIYAEHKEKGAMRRLRGPLQTNKQPSAAVPRVSRGHSG